MWTSASAQKVLRTEQALNGVKSIKVVINLGMAELSLRRADKPGKAFTLNYDYAESERVPAFDYDVEGTMGVLHLSNESHGSLTFLGFHGDKDSVSVAVANSVPASLKMKFGVGDAKHRSRGIKISDAVFSTGVCEFKLNFSSPNLIECNDLEIKTGISSVTVENLSNAGAKYIEFNGGLGSMKIDFGGRLQHDCEVKIKSGLGSVRFQSRPTLTLQSQPRAIS